MVKNTLKMFTSKLVRAIPEKYSSKDAIFNAFNHTFKCLKTRKNEHFECKNRKKSGIFYFEFFSNCYEKKLVLKLRKQMH
jgi:hypothetical protein